MISSKLTGEITLIKNPGKGQTIRLIDQTKLTSICRTNRNHEFDWIETIIYFLFFCFSSVALHRIRVVRKSRFPVSRMTSSLNPFYYLIEQGWKYHPATNAITQPEWDDNDWKRYGILLQLDSLPKSGWALDGSGSYFDSRFHPYPTGLAINPAAHKGASEIYIDGQTYSAGSAGWANRWQGLNTLTIVPNLAVFSTRQHIRHSLFKFWNNAALAGNGENSVLSSMGMPSKKAGKTS